MAYKVTDNLVIENARIRFRNFSGKGSQYNREGDRNFCVVIDDPEQAQALADQGWNVRATTPRSEDEDPMHYIQVAVKYDNFPPKVYLVTRTRTGKMRKNLLNEETVGSLDYAEIRNVDMVISPYNWVIQEGTRNEKSGVKAYLKTLYATVEEDVFADKYDDDDLPI